MGTDTWIGPSLQGLISLYIEELGEAIDEFDTCDGSPYELGRLYEMKRVRDELTDLLDSSDPAAALDRAHNEGERSR